MDLNSDLSLRLKFGLPVGVEELLQWTYVDQKADLMMRDGGPTSRSCMDGLMLMEKLGTFVDGGGVSTNIHPVAVEVYACVEQLAEMDDDGALMAGLVVTHARSMSRPEVKPGKVRLVARFTKDGDPVIEQERRSGWPRGEWGRKCKKLYDRNRRAVASRLYLAADDDLHALSIEMYSAWHMGLGVLTRALNEQLKVPVLKTDAPAEPWAVEK